MHVVCAWIGNTAAVAAKHYLQVTEGDFTRAAEGGAQSGALAAQKAAQPASTDICQHGQETDKALAVKGFGPSLASDEKPWRTGLAPRIQPSS